MKVGVFTLRDLSRSGGTANRVNGLTQYLSGYGCKAVLFSQYPLSKFLQGKVRYVSVKVSRFISRLSLIYALYPKMSFVKYLIPFLHPVLEIGREGIDIIHAHKHTSGFIALAIKDRLKVPLLFDVHGILSLQAEDMVWTQRDKVVYAFYLKAESNLFKLTDGLAVPSQRMKHYLVKNFDVREESIYVLPDGVDVSFFQKNIAVKDRNAIRTRYNLDGKSVILFAGTFKELGGIRDLLQAFEILCKREKNVALVMIGHGKLFPFVQEYKNRRTMNNLILLGYLPISELPKYQSIADILVVPEKESIYNHMVPHIKLLECLAGGRPTVATNLGGISDIITHKQNGILVEPSNPKSLAEGIRLLLDDRKLRETIGRNGPSSIPKEYTWEYSAKKAVEAYEDLIQKRKTQGCLS